MWEHLCSRELWADSSAFRISMAGTVRSGLTVMVGLVRLEIAINAGVDVGILGARAGRDKACRMCDTGLG